jgi:hypothetical protein
MNEYLILIYDAEEPYADATPELWRKVKQSHEDFAKIVARKGGKVLDLQALDWTRAATSIRGDAVTTGPFVHTTPALCGYYRIEANDLEHAAEIGKHCPAMFGGVEVRPVRHVPSA